ncbi:MAG: alpha/beta fold hydrolase [Legionellales bacterium]|nr:alpha/beta fold hydrolase [Legionellales bacterium]
MKNNQSTQENHENDRFLEEMNTALQTIWHYYGILVQRFFSDHHAHPQTGLMELQRLWLTFQKVLWASYWDIFNHPQPLIQQGIFFIEQQQLLCRDIIQQVLTGKIASNIKPAPADRRFKHRGWSEQALFNYLKQTYLLTEQCLTTIYDNLASLDKLALKQAQFYLRLTLETFSPSNFWLTNPDIQEYTFEQRGLNLLKGLAHYLEDLSLWQGYVNLKKTPLNAFRVGKTLAYTKGAVIFENELIQLIQYQATTPQVYPEPLLFVTSWINKYYILDLRRSNSLIRWAIDQGYTVFAISWVNPQVEQNHFNFSDYVQLGVYQALKVIRRRCHNETIHTFGFCLGGTLLAATCAYLAAKQFDWIKTLTLVGALLDFQESGFIQYYSGDDQIAFFEQSMQFDGLWDGRKMATAFNTLESNQFIWPYYINQYLRGRQPLALDSLYWSMDITHTPHGLFLFYLRELLQKNSLSNPNTIIIDDCDLDLTKISVPCYTVAMRDDTISPWQGCYRNTQLLSGHHHFILVEAGHVAGAINSPYKQKYGYLKNTHLTLDANEWEKTAQRYSGSWWPDWMEMLIKASGDIIPAREICDALTTAPGRYALTQLIPPSEYGDDSC